MADQINTKTNESVLVITDKEIKKAREIHNMGDSKNVNDNISAIQEWCQKQHHFVTKDVDTAVLERLLLLGGGSIEKTKQRMEKLFSTRRVMSEISLNKELDEFEKMLDVVHYVALPKLNPADQSRVMITKFECDKYDDFNVTTYFRYAFLMGEYRFMNDYSFAERYIVDLSNTNISLLGKVNPLVIKKVEILSMEGYGTKIKGIHILNAPSFVDKMVFILKQALKEKIANRIFVHRTYEDFHKHISKSILPKDYGGDGPSISKLSALWKEELQTPAAKYCNQHFNRLITDESVRQNGKVNEEYLGMQGSFRNLTVD